MHSIRSFLLVTGAILGFAIATPALAAFVPFTVTKTCSNPDPTPGSIPGICTISASSIAALVGGKIYYYGPLPTNPTFLGSTVVLVTSAGDTASGYCNIYSALAPREGMCAFHDGSGALAGLQAVAKVTVNTSVAPAIWTWIGVETHLGP